MAAWGRNSRGWIGSYQRGETMNDRDWMIRLIKGDVIVKEGKQARLGNDNMMEYREVVDAHNMTVWKPITAEQMGFWLRNG